MRRSSMNKKIVSLMVVMFSVVLLAACGGDKAKIAIGPVGSETNSASKVILGAYGLDEGDYEGFQEDFSGAADGVQDGNIDITDRKSTRLNSSHVAISYAVFCLKK